MSSQTTDVKPELAKDQPARQYIGGWKLVMLLESLTLVTFLSLLDMSIIGTVYSTTGHMAHPVTTADCV